MKVKEMESFQNGTVRIVLEPEHPAEQAMIKLMDDCAATCEAKTQTAQAQSEQGQTATVQCLNISVTVKKSQGY